MTLFGVIGPNQGSVSSFFQEVKNCNKNLHSRSAVKEGTFCNEFKNAISRSDSNRNIGNFSMIGVWNQSPFEIEHKIGVWNQSQNVYMLFIRP